MIQMLPGIPQIRADFGSLQAVLHGALQVFPAEQGLDGAAEDLLEFCEVDQASGIEPAFPVSCCLIKIYYQYSRTPHKLQSRKYAKSVSTSGFS